MPSIGPISLSHGLTSYRSSSTSDDWERATWNADYTWSLPSGYKITSYTLVVTVSQTGATTTAAGISLTGGANTITLPVASGGEYAESLRVAYAYKPYFQSAATSTVSTSTFTTSLTVNTELVSSVEPPTGGGDDGDDDGGGETDPDGVRCSPPTRLSLSADKSRGENVTLSWFDASAGSGSAISGYAIQGKDINGSWESVGTVSTPSTVGAKSVAPSSTPGTYRYFRVKTLAAAGSTYDSDWSAASPPLYREPEETTDPDTPAGGDTPGGEDTPGDGTKTPCQPPAFASLTEISSRGESVSMYWSSASAGTDNAIVGYEVQYRDGGGSWRSYATVTSTATSGMISVDPSPTPGVTRDFRVRTLGAAGTGYHSGWYELAVGLLRVDDEEVPDEPDLPPTEDGDKTPCEAPTGSALSASVSSGEQVIMSWSGAQGGENNDISYYEIEYRDDDGAWTTLGRIESTQSYGSTFVAPSEYTGVVRRFRIRTVGTAGTLYYSTWHDVIGTLTRENGLDPDAPGGGDVDSRPQQLPPVEANPMSITCYRSSSSSNDWGKESRIVTFNYELPEKSTITGYILRVHASQGGSILRADGVNLSSGDNEISLPVAEGSEHANSKSVLFEYKPHYQSGATSIVSTCTFSALQLIVIYVMDYTPVTPPVYIRLLSTQSAGEPVLLEWNGALPGKDNDIAGYEIQVKTDNGGWMSYAQAPHTTGMESINVYPPDRVGSVSWYRIRTLGAAGEDYSSDWLYTTQSLMRIGGDGQVAAKQKPRLPRLMDRDMREIGRIHPSNIELTLNLSPLSTATITMPDDEEIVPRQFVEIYTTRGTAGIFQVQSVEHDLNTHEYIAECSHGLVTLADSLVMMQEGEETGAAIGSFAEVIEQLLTFQTAKTTSGISMWRVGTVTVPEVITAVYTYNNENLLTAITGLRDQAGTDYVWTFDQSTMPWRLNLVNAQANLSEGRLSRNIAKAKVTVDAGNMCTRLYAYGMGEGKDRITLKTVTPDGVDYLDADTKGVYGEIVQAINSDEIYESAVLLKVAESYLERHKEPAVSVEVDAIDLSDETGEAMDAYECGQLFRLPLPGYKTTITERVVSMAWEDLLGDPDNVRLTLANKSQEASDEIADLIRKSTAAPLVGGSVQEHKFSTSYPSWGGEFVVLNFNVGVYPAILSIKLDYSLSTAVYHRLLVDSVDVDSSYKSSRSMDITSRLKRDESGSLTGNHTVSIFVGNSVMDLVTVKINVKMTTIEKK